MKQNVYDLPEIPDYGHFQIHNDLKSSNMLHLAECFILHYLLLV